MSSALKTLFAKGDALTPRERIILFVLLLAGVWALADVALTSPLERARQAETARIQAAQERLRLAQEALARQAGEAPPQVAAQNRLEAAKAAFNARMAEARSLQSRLVSPKDMPGVLRDLTRVQPDLRLVSLRTLPPEPVGAAPGADKAAADHPAALYRHGVLLTLAGSYANLVAYMQALERRPVGFYWAQAKLDARRHPEILLTLTLNTLSLERQWLML